MTPQPRDISDRHQTEAFARSLRIARAAEDRDFTGMMAVPQFRAFVWKLLESTHLFETSMAADPHMTAFREGERNIGLVLMAQVNRLCPELYPTMAQEAAKRRQAIGG